MNTESKNTELCASWAAAMVTLSKQIGILWWSGGTYTPVRSQLVQRALASTHTLGCQQTCLQDHTHLDQPFLTQSKHNQVPMQRSLSLDINTSWEHWINQSKIDLEQSVHKRYTLTVARSIEELWAMRGFVSIYLEAKCNNKVWVVAIFWLCL